MIEEPSTPISPQALLRYHVVSEVTARVLAGMNDAQAIRDVLALPHVDHHHHAVRLTERTVYRWLRDYRELGILGLEASPRPKVADSAVLSPKFVRFLKEEKKRDPKVSLPELIRRARQLGHLGENEAIDRTTIWRACRRLGLPLNRPSRQRDRDMRRFAYPQRMLMVLADGKHFRAGSQRLKRVALSFIDDASRYVLGSVVGTSESTELFLKALHQVILQFGLMLALFLDNAGGFVSDDTRIVLARLRIHFIYGTAGYPEGHGKIERWHRTMSDQLLRAFDRNPTVDPDPAALTLRLNHWIRHHYNLTPHEALNGVTPAQRWAQDSRDLAFPERPWLDSRFLISCERYVHRDNVVMIDSVPYEMPRGHADSNILVTRNLLEPDLFSVLHHGRQVRIHPADLTANAYAHRARSALSPPPPDSPPDTAAHLAFQTDFAPIVGPDGGYPKGTDHDSDSNQP